MICIVSTYIASFNQHLQHLTEIPVGFKISPLTGVLLKGAWGTVAEVPSVSTALTRSAGHSVSGDSHVEEGWEQVLFPSQTHDVIYDMGPHHLSCFACPFRLQEVLAALLCRGRRS